MILSTQSLGYRVVCAPYTKMSIQNPKEMRVSFENFIIDQQKHLTINIYTFTTSFVLKDFKKVKTLIRDKIAL